MRTTRRNVVVRRSPPGTLQTKRSPFGAHPRIRVRAVLAQVSSRNTSRLGSSNFAAPPRHAGLLLCPRGRARRPAGVLSVKPSRVTTFHITAQLALTRCESCSQERNSFSLPSGTARIRALPAPLSYPDRPIPRRKSCPYAYPRRHPPLPPTKAGVPRTASTPCRKRLSRFQSARQGLGRQLVNFFAQRRAG